MLGRRLHEEVSGLYAHEERLGIDPEAAVRHRRQCCDAWNELMDQPWRIRSIGRRDWADAGITSSALHSW
jgi:hypothetical protein